VERPAGTLAAPGSALWTLKKRTQHRLFTPVRPPQPAPLSNKQHQKTNPAPPLPRRCGPHKPHLPQTNNAMKQTQHRPFPPVRPPHPHPPQTNNAMKQTQHRLFTPVQPIPPTSKQRQHRPFPPVRPPNPPLSEVGFLARLAKREEREMVVVSRAPPVTDWRGAGGEARPPQLDHFRHRAYSYTHQSPCAKCGITKESQRRQYALQKRPIALGWPRST